MMRPLSSIIAALTAVTVVSACNTDPTEPPSTTGTPPERISPNWPPLLNDFRFHWTAAPGIDVTTGPAMIVRAYLESYNTAWFTLNLDNLFPGFRRATPENQESVGDFLWQLVNIRPLGRGFTKTAKDARPHFGYQDLHFLELTPVGKWLPRHRVRRHVRAFRRKYRTGQENSFLSVPTRIPRNRFR